ncbi:DUF4365 domain-containing protein [Sphingomonas sp. PP-CE-1G-424]|uniref:DUF4365 domain-containing protein n=1 Tax=Sphingomonas sp. PP-CE-1G-424 TaxID=2135658 RepID=UPI001056D614|nr:DUF4365 domain-containing protein [Sphingomonas sp. PP-CE-1G-424]TCP64595.1 phospholipase D-like protein [Sphingomonas sp. PP-CE-1G-424]
MRYEHSAAQGDQGVTFVKLLIERQLGWIFRYISGPDVGIDGLVEQVKDGEVTARWISTQIKSGSSYFSESGRDGVVFRDSREHLDYYLQHDCAVVVILHHPETDEAIWQWVDQRTVVETQKGWKLLVPHDQRLGASTAGAWSRRLRGRRRPPLLADLQPVTTVSDGSLATIHDVLESAEHSLLVSAPHLSVEMLALLEFVASRLDVRVLTSEASLAAPILRMARPERLALRIVEQLHAKMFVVDNEAACLTSANFTNRGAASSAREVITIVRAPDVVEGARQGFEEAWMNGRPASYFDLT